MRLNTHTKKKPFGRLVDLNYHINNLFCPLKNNNISYIVLDKFYIYQDHDQCKQTMSQKKKELFTRSCRFRNRGTGPQSEHNILYNNHRVSVNNEGIDFDTLPENELLKISTQISSELEENSKGENSANNHVNTNFSILTDRRQVYISPNIEQTIDHSSSECKTPVEDIDPVQNNVRRKTTIEY